MKPTFNQRLRYQFDNLMSRGTPALIIGLFVISLLVILVAAFIISVFSLRQLDSPDTLSFGEGLRLKPGDSVEVGFSRFGRPLTNRIIAQKALEKPVGVSVLK